MTVHPLQQNYIIHCIDFVMRGESQAFRFYLYHLLPHLPNTFVSSTLRTVLDGQPPPHTHTHTTVHLRNSKQLPFINSY